MRRRLVLVAAATTVMVTIAFLLPLAMLVRTLAAERALTAARQVAGALGPVLATSGPDDIEVALATARRNAPGPVTVVLPDDRVLGDVEPTAADVARARSGEAFTTQLAGARDVITPILGEAGMTVVHVRVPTEVLTAGVWQAWAVLAGLGLVLVGGAVAVADRLGRAVVRPADDVASAARRLAAGDRHARAPVAGPPEIADVAGALNGLADRIDDLLVAEREAAADMSHRLRTPLTALRLDVESLPTGPPRDRLDLDLAAMEGAIDRLIRHARAGTTAAGPADLTRVVKDRIGFWAPLVEDEERQLHTDVAEAPTWVAVGPEDLAAAVDVLIDNVLMHTEVGTALGVTVRVDVDTAALVVHDAGPGMPDPAVADRGRSGRSSTGLGLDICRRLAEDAGGRFALGAGPLGGAAVTLVLPLASPG